MKNTTLVGLAVVALIAVGGAVYFLPSASPSAGTQETAAVGNANQSGAYTGSVSDLMGRQGSWKCTMNTNTDQAVSSGVIYSSSGKVRGDFTTNVSGYGSMESHMIADGTDVYTWSPMMPMGIKVPMTASASAQSSAGASGSASFSAGTAYSYDCEPWTADASVFAVPTDVSFRTLAQ
ncbi:MAG TPA: hypothetical protein VMT80_01600 [Candidatus Paceibacterota bacterium]|nr:hypothetical protein [Candidatus Paceibacterota bacterium]